MSGNAEIHSPNPRFRPPHVRRRQILDASARLVVEHGYEGITMEQVAEEAGIAKGTIYLYLPSKQSLLASLQADLAQLFLDAPLEMMADESSTWLDRLNAVVRRRLEVRLSHSKLYHELFHVNRVGADEEPLEQARALIAEILERGTEAGEFDVRDVPVTADFLLHAAGGACDHIDRSNNAQKDQTVREVQRLFQRVVCPLPDQRPREDSPQAAAGDE